MFHIQILTEVSPHSKSSAARHAGSSPARGTMIAARRASRVACKQWYTVYDAALAFSEGTAMTAYRFQRREFLQAAPVVAGGLAFAPGAGAASAVEPPIASAAFPVGRDYPLRATPFWDVTLTDAFWAPKETGRASCRERVCQYV